MKKLFYLFLGILAGLPMGLSLIASMVAALFHCDVNEGVTSVCLVGGKDIGGVLQSLFTCFWFMFLTVPIAGIIVLLVEAADFFSRLASKNKK